MMINATAHDDGTVSVSFTNAQATTTALGLAPDIALRAMAALVQGRSDYALPFTLSHVSDRDYIFVHVGNGSTTNLAMNDDWRDGANATLARLADILTGGE